MVRGEIEAGEPTRFIPRFIPDLDSDDRVIADYFERGHNPGYRAGQVWRAVGYIADHLAHSDVTRRAARILTAPPSAGPAWREHGIRDAPELDGQDAKCRQCRTVWRVTAENGAYDVNSAGEPLCFACAVSSGAGDVAMPVVAGVIVKRPRRPRKPRTPKPAGPAQQDGPAAACSTCGGARSIECAAHVAGDGCDGGRIACPDCAGADDAPTVTG